MCLFITALLPPRAHVEALAQLAKPHGLKLEILANAAVAASLLQPGEIYCRTTSGHCDCGSALLNYEAETANPSTRIERRRRNGWSEAKIARAIAQSAGAQQRQAATRHAEGANDAGNWWRFLDAALATGVPYFCLVLHQYSGDVDSEVFPTQREKVALPDADSLNGSLEEDVVYEFHRNRDSRGT
jgi:hypothetical protein